MFKEIYYFFRRTWCRLTWKLDKFRGRCQRFKRGYSYGDVWNIDFWFMHTVRPMLVHLRDYGMTIPNELYVDGENERVNWENTLTEMINCLDMMEEEKVHEHLGFGYFGDWRDMTLEDYERTAEIMHNNKDRFFELFSIYFYNLWD